MSSLPESQLVLQQFHARVRALRNEIALTQPVGGGVCRDYTWEQVSDEARRMAAHLKSLGHPPGSCIAMISKNCAHFIIAELAIWMAGYTSVALFPTFDGKTIRYILEHSESKLMFVGKLDDLKDLREGLIPGLPCIAFPLAPPTEFTKWDDVVAKSEPLPGEPVRAGEDLSLIIYTSGSTGTPKGVMHSFATISEGAKAFCSVVSLNQNDRVLSYLPLAHAFERAVIEATQFLAGFRIYFAESLDTFIADIKRARPTVFISVPRLWLKFQLGVFKSMPQQKLKNLLRIPILSGIVKKKVLTGLGLEHVRFAASGSAPIPPELIQWYRDLGLELLEGYGISENFSCSHVSRPGRTRVGYVGHAMPGVDCKISPEGEVLVRGPASMLGYYKEPELSRESFTPDGFLRTGDRGEIDSDGRLKITGRVKELFKTSKGKYVAPAPIENLLNADSTIELCCVAGSGQPEAHATVQLAEQLLGKAGTAEGRAEIEAALAALLKSVNSQVPEWESLAFLAVVSERWSIENGFLTPTMKIKRSVIEAAYADKLESWYGSRKPVIWA